MFFDRTAFLVLGAVAIGSVIYVYRTRNADTEGKIEALGGRAQRIPSWLPFGEAACNGSGRYSKG